MNRPSIQIPAVLVATMFAAWSAPTAFISTALADGNVTVTVSNNGNLSVKGQNNTAHEIVITANPLSTTSFTFSNLEGTTTFNGQQQLSVIGVDGKVRIDLGSGPKALIMTEGTSDYIRFHNDLRITNRGNDGVIIIFDSLNVNGRTQVNTKNGDDAVVVFNSYFDDQTKINTGKGNDVVSVTNDVLVNDELRINTGNGEDYSILFDTVVTRALDVRGGGQNDTTGVYFSQIFTGQINGNNGTDIFETDVPDPVPFSIQSCELEYNIGPAGMIALARAENHTFDEAVIAFFILGLGG